MFWNPDALIAKSGVYLEEASFTGNRFIGWLKKVDFDTLLDCILSRIPGELVIRNGNYRK